MRSCWALAVAGARLAPSPRRDPSAVPGPTPAAETFRKSRRERDIMSVLEVKSCGSRLGKVPVEARDGTAPAL
jgi:hypothetical protein